MADEATLSARYFTYASGDAGMVASSMIIIGIQLFMVIYAFDVFLRMSPEKRKGRLPYMILNWVFFILPSIGTLLLFYRHFNIWWDVQSPLDFPKHRATQLMWTVHTNNTLVCLSILLGDSLMLYRCYIMWADKLWVMIVPGLLYIATAVLCLMFIVLRIQSIASSFTPIWVSFISCSISFTILITCLIAGRLIFARRFMAKALGVSFSDSRAKGDGSIMGASTILIESAVPLAVFGLAEAILEDISKKAALRGNVRFYLVNCTFNVLYSAFVVLSPQMIIFRVTMGRSWVSNASIQQSMTATSVAGGLVFAREADAGETSKTHTKHLEDGTFQDDSDSRSYVGSGSETKEITDETRVVGDEEKRLGGSTV